MKVFRHFVSQNLRRHFPKDFGGDITFGLRLLRPFVGICSSSVPLYLLVIAYFLCLLCVADQYSVFFLCFLLLRPLLVFARCQRCFSCGDNTVVLFLL